MKIVTTTTLTESELNYIYQIHQDVFGDIHRFTDKLIQKSHLVFTLSIENEKVVGYKIGYPLDDKRFYSWMGAVAPEARNRGIATKLMSTQHNWAQSQGYQSIDTKTMNRWRQMLLLNIRHGFDVKAVTVDEHGVEKILLRKQLYQ
ncbi:GNAT family N-acetyltransferase [Exiguobacterium sp. s36]|uniref:GNAT family N-acetyltransferase n=1 Tax=Exiguobacterium sp. s36 TaxID=2751227 RepID=UPI001BE84069|nr:GNAT family N-acetyltransferase [Exiguobacterium sp. s36]